MGLPGSTPGRGNATEREPIILNTEGNVDAYTFALRDAAGRTIGETTRVPTRHAGWLSVRFNGRRYVLAGGIRTPYWINVTRPIPSQGLT